MFIELFLGGVIITITVAVQAIVIGVIEILFNKLKPWVAKPPRIAKMIFALICAVLVIMVGVSMSVWIWAAVFLAVGSLDTLEQAIYFATVSFTTLGYGDVTLESEWRILSALTAANGLIIFGLSTAFLMEFILELRNAQRAYSNENEL